MAFYFCFLGHLGHRVQTDFLLMALLSLISARIQQGLEVSPKATCEGLFSSFWHVGMGSMVGGSKVIGLWLAGPQVSPPFLLPSSAVHSHPMGGLIAEARGQKHRAK